jgi:hypothetical protein
MTHFSCETAMRLKQMTGPFVRITVKHVSPCFMLHASPVMCAGSHCKIQLLILQTSFMFQASCFLLPRRAARFKLKHVYNQMLTYLLGIRRGIPESHFVRKK